MKHFSRLAAGIAFAVCISSAARAQGTPPSSPPADSMHGHGGMRGGPGGRGMMLFKGITLTSTQKDSVKKIMQSMRSQMDAARGQRQAGTKPDSATRANMMNMMQQQQAALRGVLTADQQATFDKNVADMKAHRHDGKGHGGPPPAQQ